VLAGAAGVLHRHGVGEGHRQLGQQRLRVGVDRDVLGVDRGGLGHVVHAALALLLLKLQGDAADLVAALDAAHQMLQARARSGNGDKKKVGPRR